MLDLHLMQIKCILNNSYFEILQKGFVEPHSADGLLEIFGLKQGWHASFVMSELISAKHIAQVLPLSHNLPNFMHLSGHNQSRSYLLS